MIIITYNIKLLLCQSRAERMSDDLNAARPRPTIGDFLFGRREWII